MNIKTAATVLLCLNAAADFQTSVTAAEPDDAENNFRIVSPDGHEYITLNDIKSYDRRTHTITLVGGLRERLLKQLRSQLVGGCPFQVMAGERLLYEGNFTTSLSSISLDTPVINLNPIVPDLTDEQIQVTLGYPTQEFFRNCDPRETAGLTAALSEKLTDSGPGLKLTAALSADRIRHTDDITVTLRIESTDGRKHTFSIGAIPSCFGIYVLGPWGPVPSHSVRNWMHGQMSGARQVVITPDKPFTIQFRLSEFFRISAADAVPHHRPTEITPGEYQLNIRFFAEELLIPEPVSCGPETFAVIKNDAGN